MYSVQKLEEYLKRAGADFELINQKTPIVRAEDSLPVLFPPITGGWILRA